MILEGCAVATVAGEVHRDGHVVIPQPETVFGAGDELVAIAATGTEQALRATIVG